MSWVWGLFVAIAGIVVGVWAKIRGLEVKNSELEKKDVKNELDKISNNNSHLDLKSSVDKGRRLFHDD